MTHRGGYVEDMFRRLSKERIDETTETVLREHREEIESLRPIACTTRHLDESSQ
jgi:hypothetical protein